MKPKKKKPLYEYEILIKVAKGYTYRLDARSPKEAKDAVRRKLLGEEVISCVITKETLINETL